MVACVSNLVLGRGRKTGRFLKPTALRLNKRPCSKMLRWKLIKERHLNTSTYYITYNLEKKENKTKDCVLALLCWTRRKVRKQEEGDHMDLEKVDKHRLDATCGILFKRAKFAVP